jgi:hypothetical protein
MSLINLINLILSLENIILTINKTGKNQYYKLGLKGESKNNKIFIKDLRKKNKKKNHNIKHQILNIKI